MRSYILDLEENFGCDTKSGKKIYFYTKQFKVFKQSKKLKINIDNVDQEKLSIEIKKSMPQNDERRTSHRGKSMGGRTAGPGQS